MAITILVRVIVIVAPIFSCCISVRSPETVIKLRASVPSHCDVCCADVGSGLGQWSSAAASMTLAMAGPARLSRVHQGPQASGQHKLGLETRQ